MRAHSVRAVVVDPVLVATSGDSLAGAEVAAAIVRHLFPLATVVTPNIPEASVMLGAWQRPLWIVTEMVKLMLSCALCGSFLLGLIHRSVA